MENIYIKFGEAGQPTLEEAVAEMERLGYRQYDSCDAMDLSSNVLEWDEDGDYWIASRYDESEFKLAHKEHLIQPQWVYVSNESEEDAIRGCKTILLYDAWEKCVYNRYLCVRSNYIKQYQNWENFECYSWKYIVPVEEEVETLTIWDNTYNKAEIEEALKNIKPL